MRISDIANWAACEAMALQSPPRPAGRTNVAAYVGTLAHGWLAGIPPEHPGRLAYDALTPTDHAVVVQAEAIAAKAQELLSAQGWGVIGQEEELRREELVGHLDIRAWHSDYGEAIIDLKTGQGVGAAWLQVGGYLLLSRYSDPVSNPDWGGVMHVPRVAIHKDVKGSLECREAVPLMQAWGQSITRIDAIEGGARPTYSPGIHCGRCGIQNCPVRI